MSEPADSAIPVAVAKVATVGVFAGAAQMSPLEWMQFGAAAVAILYGAAQTFFLLRDKWWRERNK